jgi:DNA-binding GntR family transcriptional regulator
MAKPLSPYVQLANGLRKDILQGKYGTKGGLPGIEELTRTSGLSRGTVYKSLALLQGERVIVERDRNYFVNVVPTVMTQYVLPIASRMSELRRTGYVKTVGKVERIQLPEYVANRLDITHPMEVVLQTCVSGDLAEDDTERPMQLSRFYYLMSVSDEQIARMQVDAVYDILLDAPPHLIRDDEVFPRFPTEDEINHLHVTEGTPVLNVMSTVLVRDDSGAVLLFQDLTRPPHAVLKYRYAFENRAKS